MILGAKYSDIWEFLIVLLISLLIGGGSILLYFVKIFAQSKTINFISELLYAIIGGGILMATMLFINTFDIKYYHIMAMIMGIILGGTLPLHFIRKREKHVKARLTKLRAAIRESKLYRIITK